MGILSRGRAEAPTQIRAVVGAAKRINLGRRTEIERLQRRRQLPQQRLAWAHYDSVGEIQYAYNYLANTLSRIRLYAAWSGDDRDGAPVPIGSLGNIDRDLVTTARYEIAKLDTAHGGQPGLIRAFSLNRSVAGEGYLIELDNKLGIYSTQELSIVGPTGPEALNSGARLKTRRNMVEQEIIELSKDAFMARFWRPHPGWSDEPDSAMFGVAEAVEELLMLSRMIRASAMSQVNAGILYVAEELTFERAGEVSKDIEEDNPDDPDQGNYDAFEEELNDALTEPVDDELSAMSIIPLLVRGPADMSENAIRKIELSRPFDKVAVELRANALDRILNGIDIPKDLVTGLSNVRYSNAQQISEDLYKSHIEPAAVELCEMIAVTRLRPSLLARGFDLDKVARATVWYDASEITVSANRSQDADNGHDRILISDATWRRDHGYTDDDKPNEEETARRIAEKSTIAPESAIQMMAALIPLIGDMAKDGRLVLQPSSMAPPMPPREHTVEKANPDGTPSSRAAGLPALLPAPPATTTTTTTTGESGATPPAGRLPAHTPPGQPQPVAASAKPASTAGDREMRQLLQVERNLRISLQTMFTDMTERALEKTGSRLASKFRGDSKQSAMIKDVPKTLVASVLGEQVVRAAGFTNQQIANEQVEQAQNKYLQAVGRAQAQADQIVGDSVFSGNDADINQSWHLLKPLLIAHIVKSLFRKQTDGYEPKLPMDSVRQALARAGGGEHNISGQPAPGAVLNSTAIDALATRFDADTGGYRWVYGISDDHFEPHLELDGAEFSSWRDDVLKNPGKWPAVDFLHPGDHSGCQCDVYPSLVPRQPHEGEIGMKGTTQHEAHQTVTA